MKGLYKNTIATRKVSSHSTITPLSFNYHPIIIYARVSSPRRTFIFASVSCNEPHKSKPSIPLHLIFHPPSPTHPPKSSPKSKKQQQTNKKPSKSFLPSSHIEFLERSKYGSFNKKKHNMD